MPSVAQITYFTASDGYRSGAISLDGPLTRISKADGLNRSYVGYQTEDSSVVFWVNDWATKDAQEAFTRQADYAEVEATSRLAFSSEPTVNYVKFEDAMGPLGAPITEFVTFTLKEGHNMAQLERLVQELHQSFAGTRQFHGDSWALIVGKPNVYHGILGWDSVEAHWEAVSGGRLKEVIDRVKEIANLWLVHAELKVFSA